MTEISIAVRNCNVLTVRLDPNEISGQGSAARPILYIPLKVLMLPIMGGQGELHYQLLRFAGTLHYGSLPQFAEYEVGPLLLRSDSRVFDQEVGVMVTLDHARSSNLKTRAGTVICIHDKILRANMVSRTETI